MNDYGLYVGMYIISYISAALHTYAIYINQECWTATLANMWVVIINLYIINNHEFKEWSGIDIWSVSWCS